MADALGIRQYRIAGLLHRSGECPVIDDSLPLREKGIECIELIPLRNDPSNLIRFVEYFHERGFIITFGTEHNTPDLIPLTVNGKSSASLDEKLKKIAWEGACIIAAHQYLRADGRQGYVLPERTGNLEQRKDLAGLGQLVIEYYFNRFRYEG